MSPNDPKAAIEEVLDFDKAVAVAYDFYRLHPDETLIVVTADHETGGFALGNYDSGYTMNIDCPQRCEMFGLHVDRNDAPERHGMERCPHRPRRDVGARRRHRGGRRRMEAPRKHIREQQKRSHIRSVETGIEGGRARMDHRLAHCRTGSHIRRRPHVRTVGRHARQHRNSQAAEKPVCARPSGNRGNIS